jgi:hypothetical protein
MSSIIGVGDYNETSKKYVVKAALNATKKSSSDLINTDTKHGRVVFAGGLDKATGNN